jgi:hypothetical protein
MIAKKNDKIGAIDHGTLSTQIPKEFIIPYNESSLRPMARRSLRSLKERRDCWRV